MVAINDCLYRNMFAAKYITFQVRTDSIVICDGNSRNWCSCLLNNCVTFGLLCIWGFHVNISFSHTLSCTPTDLLGDLKTKVGWKNKRMAELINDWADRPTDRQAYSYTGVGPFVDYCSHIAFCRLLSFCHRQFLLSLLHKDIDEYVIPHKHVRWRDMIAEIEARHLKMMTHKNETANSITEVWNPSVI